MVSREPTSVITVGVHLLASVLKLFSVFTLGAYYFIRYSGSNVEAVSPSVIKY